MGAETCLFTQPITSFWGQHDYKSAAAQFYSSAGFVTREVLVGALLLGAPRNSVSRQVSRWAPIFSAQHWAYRFPLACALWHELRNVLKRIASLHETGAVDNGLDLGNPSQECRAGNDDYRAHIEGIRNLRKHLPMGDPI